MMTVAPASAQHFGGEIAGMGARRRGVAILRADRDGPGSPRSFGERRDQGRRRTHQQIGLAGNTERARNHGIEFRHGRSEAVHLPIAGD